MKKVYLVACCLLAFVFSNNPVSAQGVLSLYTTSSSNTTLPMGGMVSINTKLVNTSATDTFNGLIDFELANGNGIINDINVFGEPQISGTVFKLAPQEEKLLLFTVTPNASYFAPGPDIIIVWPIAASANAIIDSARVAINILQSTGVNETDMQQIRILNTGTDLFISTGSEKIATERVQLFNLQGQLLLQQYFNATNVHLPITELPKGIYVVELTTNNGIRKLMKFVK
jgi:hypothetical protein